MTLVLEIGPMDRFPNRNKFVSWVGMCPRVHQSGDKEYHGHMKKDSNRIVNTLLIQAANVAVIHDERHRKKYQRLRSRGMRHQVAITHIANKMARTIWLMRMRHEDSHTLRKELYDAKMKRIKRALSKTK